MALPRAGWRTSRAGFFHTTLLLLAIFLSSLAADAREPLAELRQRADAAHGSERAELCLKAAHVLAGESFSLLKQGNTEEAQAALTDAMDYAQRGAQAALDSKKKQKEVEISLRELERRLVDLERLLELEQRAPLDQDIAVLEELRFQLLASLFNRPAIP